MRAGADVGVMCGVGRGGTLHALQTVVFGRRNRDKCSFRTTA